MRSTSFPPIPFDTAMAARAIFGSNNFYVVVGDQANALFDGISLQPPSGLPEKQTHTLANLHLITIFQHRETLPDQCVVDALHDRLDWKYALHLPLKPNPMDASLLYKFRQMLSLDPASKQNFQKLLERFNEIPQIALCLDLKQDADQVVRHICRISRFVYIWEAITNTLESLAASHSNWLLTNSLPYWYERYGFARRYLNLLTEEQEQETFAKEIGRDGFYLIDAIDSSGLQELADLPEVFVLRKVWNEQFERESGEVTWKKETVADCSYYGRVRSASLEVSLRRETYHAQKTPDSTSGTGPGESFL